MSRNQHFKNTGQSKHLMSESWWRGQQGAVFYWSELWHMMVIKSGLISVSCFQVPCTHTPLLPALHPACCSLHPDSGHWQPLFHQAALSSDVTSLESSSLTSPSKVKKPPLPSRHLLLSENIQFI